MLTQRQAARLLQDPAGPALTRRLAHEVLAAGFAGEPIDAGAALLYDPARVRALAKLTRLLSGERTPRGWHARLALRAAGPWGQEFLGRRLVTPPGNPWLLWTPRLQPFPLLTRAGLTGTEAGDASSGV
jgi:hypothetical protein